MGSLKWVLSWLIVLIAGLAPMLIYWVGVIGAAVPTQGWASAPRSAPLPRQDGNP